MTDVSSILGVGLDGNDRRGGAAAPPVRTKLEVGTVASLSSSIEAEEVLLIRDTC